MVRAIDMFRGAVKALIPGAAVYVSSLNALISVEDEKGFRREARISCATIRHYGAVRAAEIAAGDLR